MKERVRELGPLLPLYRFQSSSVTLSITCTLSEIRNNNSQSLKQKKILLCSQSSSITTFPTSQKENVLLSPLQPPPSPLLKKRISCSVLFSSNIIPSETRENPAQSFNVLLSNLLFPPYQNDGTSSCIDQWQCELSKSYHQTLHEQ